MSATGPSFSDICGVDLQEVSNLNRRSNPPYVGAHQSTNLACGRARRNGCPKLGPSWRGARGIAKPFFRFSAENRDFVLGAALLLLLPRQMIHVLFPRRLARPLAPSSVWSMLEKEQERRKERGREGGMLLSGRSSCVNMTTFPLMRALCSSEEGKGHRGYCNSGFA